MDNRQFQFRRDQLCQMRGLSPDAQAEQVAGEESMHDVDDADVDVGLVEMMTMAKPVVLLG